MRASRPAWTLFVLFLLNALNFFDRSILGAIVEPLRREWSLSDAQVGWIGTAFTLLYAVVGLPLGRLADRAVRTRLLGAGALLWSAMTALSGLATSFASLFASRLGVGVGEAVCAPAAASLIGDLFPSERRGRATAVFMLGLPIGLGLSYAVGGAVAQAGDGGPRSSSPGYPGSPSPPFAWRCRSRRAVGPSRIRSAHGEGPTPRSPSSRTRPASPGSSSPARCTTSTCTR